MLLGGFVTHMVWLWYKDLTEKVEK